MSDNQSISRIPGTVNETGRDHQNAELELLRLLRRRTMRTYAEAHLSGRPVRRERLLRASHCWNKRPSIQRQILALLAGLQPEAPAL